MSLNDVKKIKNMDRFIAILDIVMQRVVEHQCV